MWDSLNTKVICGWESLSSTEVFSMEMLMGRKKKRDLLGMRDSFNGKRLSLWNDIFDMLTMAHIFLRTGISKKASKAQAIPSTPISLSILTFCIILPSLQKRPLAPSKCWTKNLKTSFNILKNTQPKKVHPPENSVDSDSDLAVDPLSHGHAVPVSLKMYIYIYIYHVSLIVNVQIHGPAIGFSPQSSM